MDYDQLAEYRKRHQARYTEKDAAADAELARKLQVVSTQEEEQKKWQTATAKDEEIARKLQEQAEYPVSDYAQPSGVGNPYSPTPAYPYYPTQPAPQYQSYPAPSQQYSSYPANPPRLANTNQAQQPLLASNSGGSCLPEVNDKCFGINTQTCVLGTAGVMVIGIVVLIIVLSL